MDLIKSTDGGYSGIGTISRNKLISIFLFLLILPVAFAENKFSEMNLDIDIDLGRTHTCAIIDAGAVSSWGGERVRSTRGRNYGAPEYPNSSSAARGKAGRRDIRGRIPHMRDSRHRSGELLGKWS